MEALQFNEELNKLFAKYKIIQPILRYISLHKDLKDFLFNNTNFLSDSATISERLCWLRKNNINNLCKICNTPTKFVNFTEGYRTYCSKDCITKDKEFINDKIKQTLLKNYGVTSALKSDKIKQKVKQTCIERYGVDSPLKSNEIKRKIEQTCLTKYGVANPLSSKNIQDKCKQTLQDKHGATNPFKIKEVQEKIKQTNLVKYGTENVFSSDLIKDKIKQRTIEIYGVTHNSQLEVIKNKKKETLLKNYGVDSPLKSDEIKNRVEQTCLYKYGVIHAGEAKEVVEKRSKTRRDIFFDLFFTSDKFKNIIRPLFTCEEYRGSKNEKYLFECVKCSNSFNSYVHNGRIPRCPSCFSLSGISLIEKEIVDFINSLNINISNNSRKIISPYELDIYLPDYNLAIEFNGLYWHSELNGKDKNYHLNKTKMCGYKGIQLIHIFEDEWIDKQEIVKSIVKNKLGIIDNKIYARKCKIKYVTQEDSYNFLFDNHLQEPIYSKYNFGLYCNNELVQLVCLSKPRFNKKYQYELIRSCSKINTQVIGGFDRLIKYAVNTLSITSLISYVDKRYFNGSGYRNNWKYLNETEANYYYTDTHKIERFSRIKFQKHKLKKLFPEHYDDNLTEWQIMQLVGYDRIWDCGNLVFEYKNGRR